MGLKVKIKAKKDEALTLDECFEAFLVEKQAVNKSAATIAAYTYSYDKWHDYIEKSGYSLAAKDVDASYIYSFSTHLLEEIKPTSINSYLRHLRSFLYWCMEHKYVEQFKIKLLTVQETVKEVYTDDELERLLRHPSRTASFVEWRSWAVINWILATGNRAGTVVAVLIGDINFARKELYINRTKTNKGMTLPLSTALANCLTEYIKKYRSEAQPTDYLFPNVGDLPLTVPALKSSIAAYNRSRDVDKTSIHLFRHTYAKLFLMNSGDVFRLQKILGHSTLDMTRKYVNLFLEDLKEDYDNYSPLDNIKRKTSRTHKIK